jgi:hypothetical protein
MYDILGDHLRAICRASNIRRTKDLAAMNPLPSSVEMCTTIEKRFKKLSSVKSIRFNRFEHSAASSRFDVFLPKTNWSLKVVISHLAPIFFCYAIPPEGRKPVKGGLNANQKRMQSRFMLSKDYEITSAELPKNVKTAALNIIDELSHFHLMNIPRSKLKKCPARSANITAELSRYSLEFFFFRSIPLFD